MVVKDKLIEKTALSLEIAEDVAESVLMWSYEKANKATQVYSQIELSGFGKLLISQGILSRRLLKYEKLLEFTINKQRISPNTYSAESFDKRVNSLTSIIIYLKSRLK